MDGIWRVRTGNAVTGAALVAAAAAVLVFVDGREGVGRYDAGVKRVILTLPYASMVLALSATALLRRPGLALALVAAAFALFVPLFVHECIPGLIGLADPAYRDPYDGGASVPFVRFDSEGAVACCLFVLAIVMLLVRRKECA
jgi:hypothetical protein